MATPEVFSAALTNQSYRPYSLVATPGGYTQTDAAGQRYAVYMPSRPPSAYDYPRGSRADSQGYPGAVLVYESSSFTGSQDAHVKADPDDITTSQDYRWELLNAGFPVVVVQVTTQSGDTELGPFGEGFFHAPGGQDRNWEQWEHPNQQKDAILAFQYIKYHHSRIMRQLKAEGFDYEWDTNYCVAGTSSGACAASEVAMKPSHAFGLGSDGEFTVSTVPNCALLMATNVAVPWAFLSTVDFFSNLPEAETGAGATTEAATLADAVDRYKYELGSWINMAGMYNRTIPHTYCWTDAAVAQITAMQGGFQKNWGEPFDDFGTVAASTAAWQATAHLISTFLALQSAYPERIHLTGGSDLQTDAYGLYTDPGGRFKQWVDTAFASQPTNPADAKSVVDFVGTHILDTPWDEDPENLKDGIWRRGQVETVGRYCVAPNPLRKYTLVTNMGNDASVGPVADELLFVGTSSRAIHGVVPLNEQRKFPGSGPLWFKSGDAGTTSYAKWSAIEVYSE